MRDDALEAVVRSAVERMNDGDLDGFLALLDDEVVMVSTMATVTGKSKVAEALRFNQGLLSDHWRTVERLVVSGDDVATWITQGAVVAETGKRWDMEQCAVWRIRGGLIESIEE